MNIMWYQRWSSNTMEAGGEVPKFDLLILFLSTFDVPDTHIKGILTTLTTV